MANQLMAWRATAAAAVSLVFSASAVAAANDEAVVLRLRGADFEFAGKLRSFDTRTYLIEAPSFGLVSLDASLYDCSGAGCTQAAQTAASPAPAEATFAIASQQSRPVETVRIAGSGAVAYDLMPALIREYGASIGGSARQHVGTNPREQLMTLTAADGSPLARFELVRQTPADAFSAVAAGTAAIAMSTRPATPAEAAVLARSAPPGSGVPGAKPLDNEQVLALDGLVVIVSPQNPVGALSLDRIAAIFSGQIKDWSELGLPAGPINVYASAEGAAASDSLDEQLLKPKQKTLSAQARRVPSEAALSDAVANDPSGIGVTSLSFLRNARGVDIAGSCRIVARPSSFAVKAEEYPLSRRLYLYTAGKNAPKAARDLLAFSSSKRAQTVIRDTQFVDQDIEEADFSDQRRRIEVLLERPNVADVDRARVRGLVSKLIDARRLSVTLRFANGSAQLDAKARQDVVRLRELLKSPALAGKTVLFIGYTDASGSARANLTLSQRRAAEVRDAVLSGDPMLSKNKTILSLGYGQLAPVACEDFASAPTLNRRVEAWVVDSAPKSDAVALGTESANGAVSEPPPRGRKRRNKG